MRTYTVRAARPDVREIDVDFVLHGATGPASAWAERAAPGDEVVLIGPNRRFPGSTGGVELPRRPSTAPRGSLLTAAVREAAGGTTELPRSAPTPQSEEDADLPWDVPSGGPGALYAWLAGEAGVVTGLRREVVELGVDRRSVAFTGYWRAGRAGGARTVTWSPLDGHADG